jgi:SpoVK/Ycf46/Vps4 family AAA+-type ATPase
MKLDDIMRGFSLGLSGQTDKLAALLDKLEIAERKKGEFAVANKLAELLAGQTTLVLEDDPEPVRPPSTELLDRLIIRPELRGQLDELIHEQRSAGVLEQNGLLQSNKALFYGPPGNGKTAAARAVAAALEIDCDLVFPSELIASRLGESESNIAQAINAKSAKPRVIFFDEFDTYGTARSEVKQATDRCYNSIVTQLTLELDRLPPTVLFIGATNLPDALDRALLRRFDLRIEFPLPSIEGRMELLRRLRDRVPPLVDLDEESFGTATEGLCFAECEGLLLRSAKRAVLKGTRAELPMELVA